MAVKITDLTTEQQDILVEAAEALAAIDATEDDEYRTFSPEDNQRLSEALTALGIPNDL